MQIASLLRSQIKQGAYQSTMKLPTEMELSQTFGVNRQTVRRSLALLTKEGMIERRQGSGSYVHDNPAARSNIISILATYINDYIFPAILQDAQAVLSQSGFSTMVSCTRNQVGVERQILQNILKNPVRGLLVEGTKTALPNPNIDLYEKLSNSGIPVVFLHGSYAAIPDTVCVADDDFQGGKLITDHLIKKGHHKIAGIFKNDDIQGHGRYFGFISALRDAGLPLPDANILWYSTEEKELLIRKKDPILLQHFLKNTIQGSTAVVCYNDEIAFVLIRALTAAGIRVPDDVAVVSFDDSSYSELCSIKITSLAHGEKHIGRVAAEKLINLLNGKSAGSESIPWTLVEKQSS